MLWLSSLTKWWPLIQISIIHDKVSTTDMLRRKKRPYLESWDYDSSCEPTHKKTWLEKSPQWHEKYHTTLNTIFHDQCTSRQQHTPIIGDTDFDISLTQKLQEACGSHSKTGGHIPFPWLHSTPEANNNNNNNERHYSSDKQRSAYTFEYTKATTLSPPLFLLYACVGLTCQQNEQSFDLDRSQVLTWQSVLQARDPNYGGREGAQVGGILWSSIIYL
jgi:hypothetical protein